MHNINSFEGDAVENENLTKSQDSLEQDNNTPEGSLAFFPVDISKEEFVRFNMIVSSTTGFMRFRKGQLFLLAGMGVLSLLMLVSDLLMYGSLDPVMVIMILFAAVAGGLMLYAAPAQVRRSAERAYDQKNLSGQSFYGYITVFKNRIEKKNDSSTVRLNFEDTVFYIENRDMLVLMAPQKPAIVIPARCLTEEFAEGVRQAVLLSIPQLRQRIVNRVIPTALGPITPTAEISPDPRWESEEGPVVEINYNRAEFVAIAKNTALRSFLKLLPFYSVMSLLAALLFSFMYNFGIGIMVYLILSGGLFGFQVMGTRAKAGRIYDQMPLNGSRVTAFFSQLGILIKNRGNPIGVRLPWSDIYRAVERPDRVDFFTQTIFLSIPKRCVSDFGELRSFVDSHYPVK